jgi:large subunit ribosomal protein L3
MKALITRKVGMTSIINDDGTETAITLLSASPNVVSQVKSDDVDGYTAVQLATEPTKKLAKPQAGHLKSIKQDLSIMREFRTHGLPEDLKVGSTLSPEVFSVGDTVTVTGTSKGKGFASAIKRHNFSRQRKSHGAKGATRRVGSIGSMYPQKIFKGKKMPGRMGGERVTIKNLKIAYVDPELQVIGIAGAVPGPKKSIILVKGEA